MSITIVIPRELVESAPRGVGLMATWSKILGVIAAIASIGAGIYLMSTESASPDATIFDALFDAMGVYFIARGL